MGSWMESLHPGTSISSGPGWEGVLRAASGRASGEQEEREKLARACEEFEAIFIQQMLKAMRRTALCSESRQEEIYRSLFDEEVSRVLARRGLGLKELLLGHLEEQALVRQKDIETQVSPVPADIESGEEK